MNKVDIDENTSKLLKDFAIIAESLKDSDGRVDEIQVLGTFLVKHLAYLYAAINHHGSEIADNQK